MSDNALYGYGVPGNGYSYPDLASALLDTDNRARVARDGPVNGLMANLSANAKAGNALASYAPGQNALLGGATPSDMMQNALYMTPGIGNALSARDAYNSYQNGDWLGAGLGALGAIPFMGTFAGVGAKTADALKLSKAKDLLQAGAAPEHIWNETGWFQGADNKWRFEIPDNNARVTKSLHDVSPLSDPLPDVYSHPDLYAAYPQIAEQTRFGATDAYSIGEGSYARTADGTNRPIIVSGYDPKRVYWSDRSVPDLMPHEVQHNIQDIEGFARGGNRFQFSNDPAVEREAQRRFEEGKAAGANLSDEDLLHNSRMAAALDTYKRLAGEVEARNVQTRMNMTPEQRMATPPWLTQVVPNDQQIVRFGSGGVQNALAADDASRMARADQLGYGSQPFYRGEASGTLPNEYPGGGFFSRDPDIAKGFAERGGQSEPREFRLNLENTFHDGMDVNAAQYSKLLNAAATHDPKLAADLSEAIAPGKGIDWLHGFAAHNPDYVVASDGGAAALRQAIERSSAPENVFRDAGFDAVSNGRDVRKLNGKGIRLKDAAFDPQLASRLGIMFGFGGASVLAPQLLSGGDR